MIEMRANSIPQVLKHIRNIRRKWNPGGENPEAIWFRGQPKRSFQLVPGLYRPNVAKYNYEEITIFEAFKALATPFAHPRPTDEWEWYFLAQHYRLPTRLLDWTENALAAIYFAVNEEMLRWDRADVAQALSEPLKPPLFDSDSPTVWMIDAGTLNKWSCNLDDVCLFAPHGANADAYLPEALSDPSAREPGIENEKPIAINPPRSNPRILAQQGTFTVHGRSGVALDEIARDQNKKGILHLACILLDRNNLTSIWDELAIAGITQLALFPELDTVAEHVKRVYQNPT
jgi:hypothetical protein